MGVGYPSPLLFYRQVTECSMQRLHTSFNTHMHTHTASCMAPTPSTSLYSHHHNIAAASILSKCTLSTHYTKACVPLYTHTPPPPQHTPFAVSPDSMTQSVPSRTALATSEVSARVGRGLLIMLSSIWGEKGEGQEGEGHCEGEVRQQQQTAIPTHTDSSH